jgi:hypothetical protein
LLHGSVAGGEADEAGHADIVGVVVFDVLFSPQSVDDRRLELAGKRQHLRVGAGTAGSAEHRHAAGTVEDIGEPQQFVRIGTDVGLFGRDPSRWRRVQGFQRDVPRKNYDGHALLRDCDAHRALQNLGNEARVGDELDVVAAFLEQDLRVGRLEIIDADLGARNVRRYREERRSAPVAVEEAVDQMQISRSAAPGADSQLAGQLRLRPRCERRCLLVPDMHPFDFAPLA